MSSKRAFEEDGEGEGRGQENDESDQSDTQQRPDDSSRSKKARWEAIDDFAIDLKNDNDNAAGGDNDDEGGKQEEVKEEEDEDEEEEDGEIFNYESHSLMEVLPTEMLEMILVKAVVMEVKDLKLVKSVWNDKADLAVERLAAVCSRWSNIVTSNFFLTQVDRILDNTAESTVRLEILLQSPIPTSVYRLAAIDDDVYVLNRPRDVDPCILVYDRNNLAEVKDVIPFTTQVFDMAGCCWSKCLYILAVEQQGSAIWRVTRDEEDMYTLSHAWILDLSLPLSSKRIFSSSGHLLVISSQAPSPTLVSVYSSDGTLLRELTPYPNDCGFIIVFSALQKANGNLVVASYDVHSRNRGPNSTFPVELKEMDETGQTLRFYRSTISGEAATVQADSYGRILLLGSSNRAEVLDAELNLVFESDPLVNGHLFYLTRAIHFNRDRNEILCLNDSPTRSLLVFSFEDE